MEFRNIGSSWQVNRDLSAVRRIEVVGAQPLANFSGLNSDSSILTGIVGWRLAEYFNSDDPFLEGIDVSLERAFHHESKEMLAELAGLKLTAAKDALQFFTDEFGRYVRFDLTGLRTRFLR
jgi:hypothetical protein